MTEADCYIIEHAISLGAIMVNDDGDILQMTDQQIVDLVKARTQPQSQTAQGIEGRNSLARKMRYDRLAEYALAMRQRFLDLGFDVPIMEGVTNEEIDLRYAAQSQGIGKPLHYTDGSISREIEDDQPRGPHYAANSYGIVSGRSPEEAAGKLLLATPPAAMPVNEALEDIRYIRKQVKTWHLNECEKNELEKTHAAIHRIEAALTPAIGDEEREAALKWVDKTYHDYGMPAPEYKTITRALKSKSRNQK